MAYWQLRLASPAIIAGVGIGGFVLGSASVALGAAAAALDYGPCVHEGDTAACVGLGLGAAGALAGAFAAPAALLLEGSLAGGILGGLGTFGLSVGFAGTVFDETIGFFGGGSAC